jgi:predicted nucleotidyltransferase
MDSRVANDMATIISRLRPELETLPGLRLAILHGSAASGRMRPDSDVDLALAFDKAMDTEQKLKLYNDLSAACGREMDIADLLVIGGLFLSQVLSQGTLFINNDPSLYYALAIQSLDFMEDMQPIIQREQVRRIKEFANGK